MATRWYWFRFLALPVTLHLQHDHRFVWTRLYGLQLGPWFFGAIKGSASLGDAVEALSEGGLS